MAKLSSADLLDTFKEMTLLELSEFVKAFEDRYRQLPSQYGEGTYTSGLLLKRALEQQGRDHNREQHLRGDRNGREETQGAGGQSGDDEGDRVRESQALRDDRHHGGGDHEHQRELHGDYASARSPTTPCVAWTRAWGLTANTACGVPAAA